MKEIRYEWTLALGSVSMDKGSDGEAYFKQRSWLNKVGKGEVYARDCNSEAKGSGLLFCI